jgi:hypothetical protein
MPQTFTIWGFFILDSPIDYWYILAIIQPIRGGTVRDETSGFDFDDGGFYVFLGGTMQRCSRLASISEPAMKEFMKSSYA